LGNVLFINAVLVVEKSFRANRGSGFNGNTMTMHNRKGHYDDTNNNNNNNSREEEEERMLLHNHHTSQYEGVELTSKNKSRVKRRLNRRWEQTAVNIV